MATLLVDGKEYELTEQQAAPMKYVEEALAVEKGKVTLFLPRSPSTISPRKPSSSSSKSCKLSTTR